MIQSGVQGYVTGTATVTVNSRLTYMAIWISTAVNAGTSGGLIPPAALMARYASTRTNTLGLSAR